MPIIDVDQIEVLSGRTFSGDEYDRAELYLDLALGEIESYLGRPVGATEFIEELEVDVNGRVFFSYTPVISVESVSSNGDLVDDDYWKATKWGLQYFSGQDESVEVSYTAGLENRAINSMLASGVLKKLAEPPLVERSSSVDDAVNLGDGVKSIRVEDFQVEYESFATSSHRSYASQASPLLIFGSTLDFLPIKKYKKVVTA